MKQEWIHISYYEQSEKVGKTFVSTASEIGITGYCDSSTNYRLNLGKCFIIFMSACLKFDLPVSMQIFDLC